MKIEREIASIVTPLERDNVQVFWKDTDSVLTKLHDGILRNKVKTDADAHDFLSSEGEGDSDSRFRVFKFRFRMRALNSLFFLQFDGERQNRHTIDLYRLWQDVFRIRVLLLFGARNTAIWLLKKGLKPARRYQSTWTEIELLDHLRRHYALVGKSHEYEATCAQLHRKVEIYEAELRTSQMYERLSMSFIRAAGPRDNILDLAKEYDKASEHYYRLFGTYSIAVSRFRIAILYSQLSQKYTHTLELCDEAEEYYKAHSHLAPRARFGELALNRLDSYLYLRDYDRGTEVTKELVNFFPVGRNNWFIYMESYFLLAMYTQRFEQALEIYNEITLHPRFSFQPEVRQEKWRVFEICLGFASRASDLVSLDARKMDVNSLLSSVPIYSKDKQGYNVPILIMHILLLLERGDLDAITQRMEALKTYRSRYLRAKTNRQSALFFKLLTIMEANDFDYERTATRGWKYYQQMKSLPSAYSEVHEGVQILSYPWLWERVLDRLREMNGKPEISARRFS